MAELKERLRADLTQAMRDRDKLRASTIRMVLSAITTEEVAGAQARELTDDDVLTVLAREAKKRRESTAAFTDAGRDELASKEQSEELVIAGYLPAQMSADEIGALVSEVVKDLGVGGQGMRAMGPVMKELGPRTKGRADGGAVAAEVRRQLG